jgi:hypothetical protein
MSNEPAWVEPGEVADATPPPPSEREVLIASITALHGSMQKEIVMLKTQLLRLDEIGAPVSRSRTRINKVDEAETDWWAHFDYDVIKGMTKGTKDQQVRAERYELS